MRIVIAEDAVLLRAGLVSLLEGNEHEVRAVADAPALLAAVRDELPDVVVTDVRMPPTDSDDGMRAALQIRSEFPRLPVLVLSQYVEERYAVDLIGGDTRGIGYLLKDRVADVDEFCEAVDRVAGGGTALDPEVVKQLLARSRRRDPLARLTAREREVLGLMAEGRSNGAIAEQLAVSAGAVEKHIGNVFAKLALPPGEQGNRRVLAVLQYLNAG